MGAGLGQRRTGRCGRGGGGGGWRIEEERRGWKGGMTVIGASTGHKWGGEGKRREEGREGGE